MVSDRHDSYSNVSLKCALCRSSISNSSETYQSETTLAIICPICTSRFPKDDIELMLKLFLAYGGYFGEFKESRVDIKAILIERLKIFDKKGGEFSSEKLNLEIIHQALLYGFTPKEYIEKLELILAE